MSPQPFGRYLLIEPRGEGGMAQVYRAVLRDVSGFEKQVALKRVHRDLCADPDFIARFLDEARIVSALSHSNIVQVFDFGQVDGEYYLAMELVEGPDLGGLLEGCRRCSQPVPIPAAIYIAARIARGLGAAHARRDARGAPAPIIHRDISPQNVLLSRDGEVKVVDFGIAIAAERAFRTRTGVIVGKCRYMAPEQARGEALDPRADIFALGALVYEILAGRPLFDGALPADVLQKVLEAPIPPLRAEVNPEVPPELEEILLRALARPRDLRPEAGNAFARELESLLHRIAPEYSRDDLAALIRAVAPDPPSPRWQEAATQPDGELAGPEGRPGDTVEVALDTQPSGEGRPSPPAAARPEPEAIVGEGAETAPVALPELAPTAPTPLRARGAPERRAPAIRSAAVLDPTPDPGPRRGHRPWLLVLAASLCGLLLGVGGRLLARSAACERVPIPRGGTVERHGWRISVESVERRGDATLVWTTVAGPPGMGAASGAGFALLAPRGPVPPRLWITSKRGALQLVFDARPSSEPPVLRFQGPRVAAIELELVDGR